MPCLKSQPRSLLYPLVTGDEVNFRLTYDGPLKAASQSDTRRTDKHLIRCVFHNQLMELFKHRHDVLEEELGTGGGPIKRDPLIQRGNFSCLAVVREYLNLVCDLDILFLRRENPGHLVSGGGDIDNRIKVLFDALRVPQDDNEVRSFPASEMALTRTIHTVNPNMQLAVDLDKQNIADQGSPALDPTLRELEQMTRWLDSIVELLRK